MLLCGMCDPGIAHGQVEVEMGQVRRSRENVSNTAITLLYRSAWNCYAKMLQREGTEQVYGWYGGNVSKIER